MNIEQIVLKKKELEEQVKDLKNQITLLKGRIEIKDSKLSRWEEKGERIRKIVGLGTLRIRKRRR